MKVFRYILFSLCLTLLALPLAPLTSILAEPIATTDLSLIVTADVATADIDGTNFSKVDRKDISSFNLELSELPPSNATSYNFSVMYKQVYYSDGIDPIAGTEPLELREKNVTTTTYSLTNAVTDTEIQYPTAWGLYTFRFTYTLPTEEVVQVDSKTFVLEPTKITEKPIITYKEVVNTQSTLAGFKFSIDNEQYEFCDQSLITWEGSALIDDTEWTLDDLGDIKRTGTTFEFMPTLEATYTIYCNVKNLDGQIIFSSAKTDVSTFLPATSVLTIILIVVGCVLGAGAILAIGIIYRVKHEKIW